MEHHLQKVLSRSRFFRSPIIKVLSPNGGEKILAGTSRKIEWISENIENVKIAYSTNNGFEWKTIIASAQATGFYIWKACAKSQFSTM